MKSFITFTGLFFVLFTFVVLAPSGRGQMIVIAPTPIVGDPLFQALEGGNMRLVDVINSRTVVVDGKENGTFIRLLLRQGPYLFLDAAAAYGCAGQVKNAFANGK